MYFKLLFVISSLGTFLFSELRASGELCGPTLELLNKQPSIVSNIEQFLCRKSYSFLYSFGSSWSLNVQLMRTAANTMASKSNNPDVGVMELLSSV